MTYDVTTNRLAEIDSMSNWMGDKPVRWVCKPGDAPLTKTERSVMIKIPESGLSMGWVSRALAYAPAVRYAFPTKTDRRALYGLLARGVLRVEHHTNPDNEIIIRNLEVR